MCTFRRISVLFHLIQTYGNNPATWDNATARCQNLGIILLGMNFSQIAACNLSSDDLLLAFGKAEATVDRDVVSSVYSIALVCITI